MRNLLRMAVMLAGLVLLTSAAASTPARVTTSLDAEWRFFLGDPAGAQGQVFDDSRWVRVSVPHDWQIAGPFDEKATGLGGQGFLPTGVAWYRRVLPVKPAPDRAYFIELDGVMERSAVYLNGHLLGERPNGYISLRYDLTPYLRADGRNVLAVRADTSAAPSSRWYAGGGIYRHVRLVETATTHFAQDGVFVTTPGVNAQSAQVRVSAEYDGPQEAHIAVTILAPDGKEALRLPPGPIRDATRVYASGRIAAPRLWSLETPVLYRAKVDLLADRDNRLLDSQTVPFGVREAKFETATGFWLNGKNIKLKGAALHENGGAVGAAVPLDVWRQRLTALKALGVNAIRTAHNPPSPQFLDLTDQMGFIVMDEFFDQWLVGKTQYDYHLHFAKWHQADVRDAVRRDRNHPSVVIWSMGNEIHDTPNAASAKASLKSIIDVVHANDPTRPATMALFRPNVSHDYDNGLADMLDVVGQNYRETELIAAHKQNPARRIIGTENTHNRSNWIPVRDDPAYAGMFVWTGVDYLGEAGAEGWPNIQQSFGLLDRTGEVKIAGMERASWWAETPVIHVVRNANPAAAGPPADDPTLAPTPIPPPNGPPPPAAAPRIALFDDWTPGNAAPHPETIEVYSNCQSVEVLLNGRSLGTKPYRRDLAPRRWTVTYQPGLVRAFCRDGGVTASDSLQTAGAPASILLVPDKTRVGSRFDDVAIVRVRVVDVNGLTVPSANQTISFKISGAGQLAAADNGSQTDHTPFGSPARAVVQGKATVLVRGRGAGRLRIEATAPGLAPARVDLTSVP